MKSGLCYELGQVVLPEMCAVLSFEGEDFPYVRLKISNRNKQKISFDSGSFSNVLPETSIKDLKLKDPKLLCLRKYFFSSARMPSGQNLPITIQTKISFQIGSHYFQVRFFILPTRGNVIPRNACFGKINITIDPKKSFLQLPDLTIQLSHILVENERKCYTKKLPKFLLFLTEKILTPPQSEVLLEHSLSKFSD